MAQREQTIVNDLVEAIRDVLKKHKVTFDEYRAGFFHLAKTGDAHEIPLLLDVFFNQTICDIEMETRKGSRSNVEGPYFLEGAPLVTDKIKVKGDVQPMLIRCQVRDLDGSPVSDVLVDLWFAGPDGNYSGYGDDFPIEYFRCKVKTDNNGKYEVLGSVPGEYSITPDRHGPTGTLIEWLGGQGWRPRHLHQKYRKEGYAPLTTQSYFKGTKYLDVDPVEAVFDDLIHELKEEDGVKVLDLEVVLDPA